MNTHIFDRDEEKTSESTKKILDILCADYIESRGVSIIEEMVSKGEGSPYNKVPMTKRDKLSLLLVYGNLKPATVFNFVFDEKQTILDLFTELSKSDGKLYCEIEETVLGYYYIRLVFTNKDWETEKMRKVARHELSNYEIGLNLGYPKDVVEASTRRDEHIRKPTEFFDNLDDMERKKLAFLVQYYVNSKEAAEEALLESERRYEFLEELDSLFTEKQLEELQSEIEDSDINSDDEVVGEKERKIMASKPVSGIIDRKTYISKDGKVIDGLY